MNMRLLPLALITLALSLSQGAPLRAASIPAGQIPDNAKWVAHLDLDELQKTRVGETLARAILDPQLGELAARLRQTLGIGIDWRQIHGITAYGTDLAKHPDDHTVLLVTSDLPLTQALQGAVALAGQGGAKGGPSPIQKFDQEGSSLYSFNGEGFATVTDKNLLVLAKSRPALSNAVLLLQGKGHPAAPSSIVGGNGSAPKEVLSVGLSDSFHQGLELPPQAQVLKRTDGARLSLREAGDSLVAKLAIRAKAADVVEQLQQALQGLMAIASLGAGENPQVQQLLKGLKVDRQENEVGVAFQYPVSEVTRLIEARVPKKSAAR
ncbi:MAG TPA: hypothetical protein DCM86_16875 [Verrucomicrobiales bacterium]|nr:hypothetical protein [Verrucomicrobiales bacterium]